MHIAQIFNNCHLVADNCFFTREFKVRRRYPIIKEGLIDFSFFTRAIFVRYDMQRQKFQYRSATESSRENRFKDMRGRYLKDSAWKYSNQSDVLPSEIKIGKPNERQSKEKIKQYVLKIEYSKDENIRSCFLKSVKKLDSKSDFKVILLRV